VKCLITLIQCVVSHPAHTTLPEGTSEITALLGAIAQLYIGRRTHIPPRINYAAAALLPVVSVLTDSNALANAWRVAHAVNECEWISAFVFLWSLCAIAAAGILGLTRKAASVNGKRREFLRASTAAACAAPIAALGFGIATRRDFRINEIDLKFPDLPKDLDGLRMLQLSDIHLGAFFTPSDLARVVDASNALRPDLVLVTGDLITTKDDPLDRCLLELRRLRASSGIWGCLGNHEYNANVEAYAQMQAQKLDIFFLRNQANALKFGDSRLNLVGVDYKSWRPYLDSVRDLVDLDSFNLLLAHTPEVFPEAADTGFDLTLSGHTHGGQINVELLGTNFNIAGVHTPYTKGLYTLQTSSIYVNSGLGTIGIPVRIGVPPEITLIRLGT